MADDGSASRSPLPQRADTNTGPEAPSAGQQEDWKQRPPYLIQSPERFGDVRWSASCHCGRVTYQLKRERPLNTKFCHCRGCQVLHGAPFQWCAIFPKAAISFTHGAEGLAFYSATEKSHNYRTPCKVSCAYCRTPIMDEGRNTCLLFPELIDFGCTEEGQKQRRKAFEVSCHIFYSRRVVEIMDGKPKWSGIDNRSELLDDYGNKVET
ncbi:Mss4-like protein [Thermoascus aurantiacus ATCC 26904]